MRKCKVKGCGKTVFARSMCSSHYKRAWRYGDPLAGGTFREFTVLRGLPSEFRFWAQTREQGECLIYTADKQNNSRAYAKIRIAGRAILAHRYAYELVCGPIPKGKQVNHTCDNRLCVRPEHLWVGSQSKNIIDMYSKGRGRSRLTPALVREIRGWLRTGKRPLELAQHFGVHIYTILRIQRNQSWGWVK